MNAPKDGHHKFYAIQARMTHKSPHGELGKLESVVGENWFYIGHSSKFDYVAEPWNRTGPNRDKPMYRKSHDETWDVYCLTGYSGWWSRKYAKKGLARIREANPKGKFDYRDGYNKVTDNVRYEFRIVKVEIKKQTKVKILREKTYMESFP